MADLDIVDWSRTNGAFRNPYQAMTHTCSWLINRAWYTISQEDMTLAPVRDDWPDWKHAGQHEELGRIWWNYFLNVGEGVSHQLAMPDVPDFCGSVTYEGVEHQVFGDIGSIPVQACVASTKQMRPGDLWISVCDTQTHIVIESDRNNVADLAAQFTLKTIVASHLRRTACGLGGCLSSLFCR